jgi:hypothetical protein
MVRLLLGLSSHALRAVCSSALERISANGDTPGLPTR